MISVGKRRYIGSSVHVARRCAAHLSTARRGREPKRLQEAFDSGERVEFMLLEEMTAEHTRADLMRMEQAWIERMKPELNAKRPVLFTDPEESLRRFARYENEARARAKASKSRRDKRRFTNKANCYARAAQECRNRYFTAMGEVG